MRASYQRLDQAGTYFCTEVELVGFLKLKSLLMFAQPGAPGPDFCGIGGDDTPMKNGAEIRRLNLAHAVGSVKNNRQDSPRLIFFKELPLAGAYADLHERGTTDGLVGLPSSIYASEPLLLRMNSVLHNSESEFRKLSSWAAEKTFVYFDISDFSTNPPGRQAVIINSLVKIVNDASLWPDHAREAFGGRASDGLEASLCRGDGYIFVFNLPNQGAYFSAFLAGLIYGLVAIEVIPEFHFRIGVHTGPVRRFWDQCGVGNGRWNYVGAGINEAERVLSAIKDKDDVVFISAETCKRIRADRLAWNVLSQWLENRGRLADKHSVLRRVYEVNHNGWVGHDLEYVIASLQTKNK